MKSELIYNGKAKGIFFYHVIMWVLFDTTLQTTIWFNGSQYAIFK